MFAYCGNNPINCADYDGNHWYFLWLDDLFAGAAGPKNDYSKTSHEIPDYRKPVYKPKNDAQSKSEEQKVLDAKFISSYKGKTVVKVPIGNQAFSCGIIFMGNKVSDVNTVKHEYGHCLQLNEIGMKKYIQYIAIPSLNGYWGNDVPYDEYYSLPWEYGAEIYGGVDRINYHYSNDASSNFEDYWRRVTN